MKLLRASFHGPLARVAINTAGPVLVLYFLATAATFAVAGIGLVGGGSPCRGADAHRNRDGRRRVPNCGQALQPMRGVGRARRGRCRSEALRPLLAGDRRAATELELIPDIGLPAPCRQAGAAVAREALARRNPEGSPTPTCDRGCARR